MAKHITKHVIDALFPRIRQTILMASLLHPEKWWYLSSLANHLEVSPSSLQRELASLVACGLLESRRDGNRVYYRANKTCPVLEDLQNLLIKTGGVADIVKNALKYFFENIDSAFIYGSIARGEEISSSDVDVMIVGDVKLADLVASIQRAEKKLGREINPIIYSRKEFISKLNNKQDGFINTVLKDKKIFLKGSEDEFQALAG